MILEKSPNPWMEYNCVENMMGPERILVFLRFVDIYDLLMDGNK
jgi:hypothetical protein